MKDGVRAIEIEDCDPLRLAFLEQSDLGNAERLKALARGKLKWIEDLQAWAWFDGRRFDVERGSIHAQRLAHEVVRHIRIEAQALYELKARCEKGDAEAMDTLTRIKGPKYSFEHLSDVARGLIKHSLRSGAASSCAGMLRQARSDLAALLEDFDRDPLAFNCGNGTLRFAERGGKWGVTFSPHDPADMLMQMAGVDYDPAADCPFWTERLELLTPDPEQLAALQPLYGYSLTGLTSDQAFYVHQGKGGDGKSATHQALAELHGDYYRHAGVKTFLQGAERGGAEHRSDLVRLRGDIRFVTCDEPKARSVWDGETIKQVTGSLITARGSGERTEVTYRPRFKLHTECNNIPRAPSDDRGFRRRFKLYQWKVSLSDTPEGEMPIDAVLARLRAESSGILNWLIAGALQWLETRTIPQPKAMTEVLSDFWADSSPLLEWMGEWCDTSDPTALSYAKDLYSHFKQWCEDAGIENVPSSTIFGRTLRDKQFTKQKDSKGLVMRKGIRLLTEAERDALFAPSAAQAPAPPSLSRSERPGGPSGVALAADEDDIP